MKGVIIQNFDGHTDQAINNVIVNAIGTPVTDGYGGPVIGKITNAQRVEGTSDVKFEIETEEGFDIS